MAWVAKANTHLGITDCNQYLNLPIFNKLGARKCGRFFDNRLGEFDSTVGLTLWLFRLGISPLFSSQCNVNLWPNKDLVIQTDDMKIGPHDTYFVGQKRRASRWIRRLYLHICIEPNVRFWGLGHGINSVPGVVINWAWLRASLLAHQLRNLFTWEFQFLYRSPAQSEGPMNEEMEVNSDQSEKHKQFIANKGDTVEKSLHRSFEESISDMQNDDKDVWDKLCIRPVGVKWPDPWCQPLAPDCANNLWSLALQRVKASWMKQGTEVCSGLYTDIIRQLTQQVKAVMGNKACWLDVERENCHQEEAIQRKKKKKQKSKGKNPFNNMHGKEPEHGTNEGGTMHGDDTRKKHKIWFSRNRRPAKNLSLQKINFSQEAIPATASLNLMGIGEIKTGHAKSKDSIPKHNIKESHMIRMDNLFEDLMARRVKLKEIASNINTTDENKMLVNSLLAMKSYKINGGRPNKPRVHTTEEREPNIELIETSNRFLLLDNDGNDLPSIQEGTYQQNNDNTDNYTHGNERWRMKQERLINIKYMQLVTQEQRYEAKRYIIDRLVPLDSSLSEWSKPMLEYFRHLCSIYEFGAGTLAATRERMNMIDPLNNDHENVEMLIEEVDSEEDDTTEMMKSDSPSVPNISKNNGERMEVCNPTDMLVSGTNAGNN
ncbi:hypothetical protein L1987_19180 [Smallanthus sonchifolius]|uniref:Uncharacterized protein n=1 Tax=Smallanthus sonchifolius TaxID=185202 RepID=A0ACB9IQH1_9ASTR|nr:hypothetical protein L1987_19180 [Smallanthus sonchifolius]